MKLKKRKYKALSVIVMIVVVFNLLFVPYGMGRAFYGYNIYDCLPDGNYLSSFFHATNTFVYDGDNQEVAFKLNLVEPDKLEKYLKDKTNSYTIEDIRYCFENYGGKIESFVVANNQYSSGIAGYQCYCSKNKNYAVVAFPDDIVDLSSIIHPDRKWKFNTGYVFDYFTDSKDHDEPYAILSQNDEKTIQNDLIPITMHKAVKCIATAGAVVSNGDKRALEGYSINFFEYNNNTIGNKVVVANTCKTTSQGSFTFNSLKKNSKYIIQLFAPEGSGYANGYYSADNPRHITNSFETATPIDVGSEDLILPAGFFKLTAGNNIAGNISFDRDVSKEAIENTKVCLYNKPAGDDFLWTSEPTDSDYDYHSDLSTFDANKYPHKEISLDENGNFDFSNVPNGDYFVGLQSNYELSTAQVFYSEDNIEGVASLHRATPIHVDEENDIFSDVRIDASFNTEIYGDIIGNGFNPSADNVVMAYRKLGGGKYDLAGYDKVKYNRDLEKYTFLVDDLPHGEYKVVLLEWLDDNDSVVRFFNNGCSTFNEAWPVYTSYINPTHFTFYTDKPTAPAFNVNSTIVKYIGSLNKTVYMTRDRVLRVPFVFNTDDSSSQAFNISIKGNGVDTVNGFATSGMTKFTPNKKQTIKVVSNNKIGTATITLKPRIGKSLTFKVIVGKVSKTPTTKKLKVSIPKTIRVSHTQNIIKTIKILKPQQATNLLYKIVAPSKYFIVDGSNRLIVKKGIHFTKTQKKHGIKTKVKISIGRATKTFTIVLKK